jgi:hypothetical protein
MGRTDPAIKKKRIALFSGGVMDATSRGNVITQLVVLSLGLLFFIPSAYNIYSYCLFRTQAITVQGVIEDPLQGKDWGGRPFIEYRDLQGNTHGFKTRAKTHWFRTPEKGETLTVYFSEDDPQNAMTDSPFHYVILPLFFGVMGGGAVMISGRELFKMVFRT